MIIQDNIRKNLSFLLLLLVIAAIVFANPQNYSEARFKTSQEIQTKQQQTHAKINHLKFLENLETNKLYKNQKRLEETTSDLQETKRNYSNAQDKLALDVTIPAIEETEFVEDKEDE